MAETHRRVVYTKDTWRVVGIFYDISKPVFIIESQGQSDSLGEKNWIFFMKLDAINNLQERVMYELLLSFALNDHEKEELGYVGR